MLPIWSQVDFNRSDLISATSPYANGGSAKRYRNLQIGTAVSGVAPTMVTDPVASLRSVLRLRTATNNGSLSRVRGQIVFCPVGTSMQTPVNQIQDVYWEVRSAFNWQSSATADFGAFSIANEAGTELFRVEIIDGGKVRTRVIASGTTAATAAAVVTEDTYGTFTIRASTGASGAGVIQVWYNGTYLSEVAQTHAQDGNPSYLDLIAYNLQAGTIFSAFHQRQVVIAAYLYDRYASTFSIAPGSMYVEDLSMGIAGDVWKDGFGSVCYKPVGGVRVAWESVGDMKAQLRYCEGEWPGDGTTGVVVGATVDLTSANQWWAGTRITGLKSDTKYSYKWRIYSNAASGTYHEQSHVSSVRTLPAQRKKWAVAVGHCEGQEKSGPRTHYAEMLMLSALVRQVPLLGMIQTGDNLYNDAGGGDYSSETAPCAVKGDMLRYEMDYVASDVCESVFRWNHALWAMWDDHDALDNEVTGACRRGYTNSSFEGVGMNPTGGNGTKFATLCGDATLSANGITYGVLWDAGRAAWNTAFVSAMKEPAFVGDGSAAQVECFRKFETGYTSFYVLDTRTFRNGSDGAQPTSGSRTVLGLGQDAWIMRELGADTKALKVLISPSAATDRLPVASNDNWQNEVAERNRIEQGVQTGKAMWITGDRHYGFVEHRFGTEVSGRVTPASKFLVNVGIGPLQKGCMPGFDDIDWTVAKVDWSGAQNVDPDITGMIRQFGVVVFNEPDESVDVIAIECPDGAAATPVYRGTFRYGGGSVTAPASP